MQRARTYRPPERRTESQRRKARTLQKRVAALARSGRLDQALLTLREEGERLSLDPVEYDILLAKIAERALYNGDTARAYDLASQSAKRSRSFVPLAGWVAGLSAWEQGRYGEAGAFFEVTATSQYASGWMAAAASYWVARSHMRSGRLETVSIWLERASAHPRTFYGLIATRALGQDFEFNWVTPPFTKEHYEALSAEPIGIRALALVAIGQQALAEAELLRLNIFNSRLRMALLSYAGYADLPSLAMRLGAILSRSQKAGNYYDAALYPTGPWNPQGGYKIDPALIYAIMRQESRFDPMAKSSSGARGLMQLMPSTARYISKNINLSGEEGLERLHDPAINLALGQNYLEELLKSKIVKGDVLSLLISYNAGPGNLSKWKARWPEVSDPLLFIELLPSSETRRYVEYVLSNYWIYRMRAGDDIPTLDSMAAGQPAYYSQSR